MMKSLLLSLLVLPIFWTTYAQDDCTGVCGRRPLATSHDSSMRIIGGTEVLPGTWPWQIVIIKPVRGRNMHICSGVLISSSWVVTAAHCFKGRQRWFLNHLMVMAGSTNLRHPGDNAQKHHIRNVTIHESYNYVGLQNDIAVVELRSQITCTDFIQPACLPDENVNISSLTHCWISGWAFTDVKMLNLMQEAKVNLIPNEICNSRDWHHGSVRNDHICAGYEEGGNGACLGDSGGPLSCRESRSEHFWVVGIFSAPDNCNQPKKPGIYTSTQFFLDWIKEKTNINFNEPVRPVTFRPKPTTQTTSEHNTNYQHKLPTFEQVNRVTSQLLHTETISNYTPRPYQTFKSWYIITTILILMGNMLVNV